MRMMVIYPHIHRNAGINSGYVDLFSHNEYDILCKSP
jgi:hypothetical protein